MSRLLSFNCIYKVSTTMEKYGLSIYGPVMGDKALYPPDKGGIYREAAAPRRVAVGHIKPFHRRSGP